MKCKLEHHRQGPNAPMTSRCNVHDWDFGNRPQTSCPIGKIEEAADKAIERIKAERAKHEPQFG